MSRATINSQPSEAFAAVQLNCATTDPQAQRLQARMAELDIAHCLETKRLSTLIARAKNKLLASTQMRKG